MDKTLRERFYGKTHSEPNSGCLMWTWGVDSKGYGRITSGGKPCLAHRVAWELANGPIPTGMCVLHRCDVPACVNPEHLFLGTHADNVADMVAKGRNVYVRGEYHGRARLTDVQVQEIREATGLQRDIAARYGVRQAHVSEIKSQRKRRSK